MHRIVPALLLFRLTALAVAEERLDLEFAKPDGQSLKLDLYLPDTATSPAPLVIWIHGGGFKAGSRKSPPVDWLIGEGFAVASISYRFTDVAVFPAQIHDCKAAVRWLRAHAEKLGIDGNRIGTIGHSAGGMLSALLGTSGGIAELEGNVGKHSGVFSAVQAVVETSGGTDYLLFAETKPNFRNLERLLGGTIEEKRDLAILASPVTHLDEEDPPLLIMQGTDDKVVPSNQAESLYRHASAAGVDATLHLVEGAGHSATRFYTGENRERIREFFETHLGDHGPAGARSTPKRD